MLYEADPSLVQALRQLHHAVLQIADCDAVGHRRMIPVDFVPAGSRGVSLSTGVNP